MSKSYMTLGIFLIFVIALAPICLGLEVKITGVSNTTFNVDNSYNIQDNQISVENSTLAEPTIIFNGNTEGVNPLSPPRLTGSFIYGNNDLNFTETINYFELNITYNIKNGYSCLQNSDCNSGVCNGDYMGGMMYCAQFSSRCVHNTGSLPANQYNDGNTDGGYKCSSGTWKANDGYTCAVGSDCYSGVCKDDYNISNGKFCTQDNTRCVHKVGALPANLYSDGGTNGGYKCSSGTWKANDGYTCAVGSDCYSGVCKDDYNISNGKFCTQDNTRCVHKVGALPANQYLAGGSSGGYKCSSGTWKANDGYACVVGGDCFSGYCRNDSVVVSNTFCAASSTNCVRNDFGIPVTQYTDGSSDGAGKKCGAGVWKTDDGYSCTVNGVCDSGYCRNDYTGGNKYCAQSISGCVHRVFGLQANQYFDGQTNGNYVCSSGTWKVDDGYACSANSNCTSGYCHTDFTSPTDKYCAQGSSRCVHLNFGTQATQYNDGGTRSNYKCDSGTWKVDDGYSCTVNGDCNSGYCRNDFDPGSYCAEDAWKCVHLKGSLPADQENFGSKVQGRRCKLGGSWGIQDADDDGVSDAIDKCPNTPNGCNVGAGDDDINAATGCPNKPINPYNIKDNPSSICVGSSLPIDPVKSVCLEQNIADYLNVSFFLTNATGQYPANNPMDCDLETGTLGWHDISDGKYYCEFTVGDDLKVGTYDLVAKYTILNVPVFSDIFRSGFTVSNLCSLDTQCKHGGHIKNQVALTGGVLTFDLSFAMDGGTYVTCVGANGTISNVAQYITQCSDGSSSSTVNPGLLVWVYDPLNMGNYVGYSDNQFQGGTFNMTPKPRRTDVFSSTLGYRWTSNLGWTKGASTNRVDDFFTFNSNGSYLVYLDYINNFCDSPDYLCPNNPHPTKGPLCDVGSLKTTGFVDLKSYDVKIISLGLDLSGNSPTETFYVSSPYNPAIRKIHTWSIKNNGAGEISITNIDVDCPAKFGCTSSPITDTDIDEADELNIDTEFSLPCEYSVTSYPINLTFDFDDGYGLACVASSSQTVSANIIQGNLSDDSAASCECYTGRNDLWGGTSGCCDPGDCWISGDKRWICSSNGEKIGASPEPCESIYVCGTDNYWDGNEWSDKIPAECKCFDSFDCETGQCIDGKCMTPVDPNVTFASSSITVEIGSKDQTVIYLKNNLGAEDTLKVKLSASPEKMNQWLKFANKKNEIEVRLGAHEEALIPLEVFGGEIGIYSVVVYGTSSTVEELNSLSEQKIAIVDNSNPEYSRTPEINWASLILVMLMAAIFMVSDAHAFR